MIFSGTTRRKVFAIYCTGFFISQALSFIHVYLSNTAYQDTLFAITKAGYFAVPNQLAAGDLTTFYAAWNGGLFFTLTIGLCLTTLSLLFAWMFRRLPVRSKLTLILPVAVWLFLVVNANLDGFSSLAFYQFLLIPPVIFIISTKVWEEPTGSTVTMHMAIFAVFAIFSASIADMNIFLDIRDGLLLNNRIGRSVNAFYYDNSLYSARVFKSPGQRLLKTCALPPELDGALSKKITARLLSHDYIPVEKSDVHHDLSIEKKGSEIELTNGNRTVKTLPIRDFLKRHTAILKDFGKQTDRHGFLRKFTMLSILFVGVLVMFLAMYLPFYILLKRYCSPLKASLGAGAFCLLCSWLFFTILGVGYQVNNDNLEETLTSSNVDSRIAALKYIHRKKIDFNVLSFYPDISEKDNIAERYWFAKNLRYMRGIKSRNTLRILLDDPHFNVVCMAFHALGYVGARQDIAIIMEKMKQSDNWYEQWYGYKAMRRLGWKQKKLE